jgi:hypothetical protein
MHECEPDGNLAARLRTRRETGTLLFLPAYVRLLRALVVVRPAEQRDVVVPEADRQ